MQQKLDLENCKIGDKVISTTKMWETIVPYDHIFTIKKIVDTDDFYVEEAPNFSCNPVYWRPAEPEDIIRINFPNKLESLINE